MNPQRIVGIIAIVTALMVGIGSNLPAMIDPPSAILVVGGVLAMLLIGRHNIGGMVSTVFSGSAPENQVKEAIQGYRMGRYYSMASGVMCLGVGITGMIKDVHDPASLGPGMAISLLGTFYAVLIGYVLFLGLQAGLQKRIGEEVDSSIVTEVLLVIVYCTVVTAVSFSILVSSIGTPTT